MDSYCEKCKQNSLNYDYICTLCGRDYSDGLIDNSQHYTVDNNGYPVQEGTHARCCDLLKHFPFVEGTKANNIKSLISNWINRRLLNKTSSKVLVSAAVHVHYDAIDMKTLSSFLNIQPMEIVKFLKNDNVNNSNFSLRHPLNVNDFLKKGLLKLTSNTYPLINELLEECKKLYNILNEMDYCEGKNPNVIATAITRIICSTNVKGKIYKVSDILNAFDSNYKTLRIRYCDMIKYLRKLLIHLPWYKPECSENDVLKEIPYIIKNGTTLVKVYQLSLSPKTENNEMNEDNNPTATIITDKSTIKPLLLCQDEIITDTTATTPIKESVNIDNSTLSTDISIFNNKSMEISKNYSISETNILPQSESMEISITQVKTPSTSESKKHKLVRDTPTPRVSKKTCIRKEYKNNTEEKKRKFVQKRRSSNRILTSERKKINK